MSVVRRGSVGAAVVLGLVLAGGPAAAQGEDPCAPGPDGSVPEMCQSDRPVSDTGTVGMEPHGPAEPCPGLPVEPGDGVVQDGGDQGEAGAGPDGEPELAQEGAQTSAEPSPGAPAEEEQVFCIAGGAPVADGAPQTAGPGANEAVAVGRLPRTGPYDRLLALTALGSGLVVVGAGAAAAGRRRRTA